MTSKKTTEFAPAETLPKSEILRQHALLKSGMDLQLLEAVPTNVLVLNQQRQLIYANERLLNTLGEESVENVLGIRPGELLNCQHSRKVFGCGTTSQCAQCGAVQSILGAASGHRTDRESRILTKLDGTVTAVTLQVHSVPLTVQGEKFIVVYLTDIGDQKRKEELERMFFHDMLNAMNGIVGAASLIQSDTEGEINELAGLVLDRALYLTHEVKAHRMMLSAEKSELEPYFEEVDPAAIIKDLVALFSRDLLLQGRAIVIRINGEKTTLTTDKSILYRVLENLLKNALEASLPGQTVEIGFRCEAECIFHVHNPAYIPVEVQHQIFQRSFSTKGKGRGIGTYSVRMLTENYLGGTASFTSTEEDGTTFTVSIPFNCAEND